MALRAGACALGAILPVGGAHASDAWTDWTSALTTGASAANVVTGRLDIGGAPIEVIFRGGTDVVELAGAGWWKAAGQPAPYSVTGAPDQNDIIRLVGGDASRYELAFSSAVVDPVIAFLSLGDSGRAVSYRFDQIPTLLSSGAGAFGGCAGCLWVDGQAVVGLEGHGAVQFKGSFTTLSWTIPEAEYWHGFTVGATPTAAAMPVPEPSLFALLSAGLLVVGFVAWRHKI